MKRITLALALLFGFALALPSAHAQVPLGPTATACRNGNCKGITDPVGACDQYTPQYTNTATSTIWACGIQNTWIQVGGGGGGGAAFPASPGIVYNTSTTASQNATSAQIVTGLNTSPSSTLVPAVLPGAGVTVINGTPCTVGSSCSPSGSGVSSSATINAENSQIQAESAVATTAYGHVALGDSITAGLGSTAPGTLGYVGLLQKRWNLASGTCGVAASTPSSMNCGVAGATAATQTFYEFATQGLNPGDTGNPIVTYAIGTNNTGCVTAACVTNYKQFHLAGAYWAALSSTYKILAGNASVTQAGTWTPDTTFAVANGLTTTAAGSLSYTAQISASGTFEVFSLSTLNVTSSYTLTVDGSPATDTITNSTTVSHTGTAFAGAITNGVWVARFAATPGSHSIVLSWNSGTLTVLGFGFPQAHRNRGTSSPRIAISGVPPQQNNANASAVAVYNQANLDDQKLLVTDGLDARFVDINTNLDPVYHFSAVANCVGSANPGLHPNNCGHAQLATLYEAAIGAPFPTANSTLTQPLNFANVTQPTTLPAASGQDTRQPTSAGTIFSPSSLCISTLANQCMGVTALDNDTYILGRPVAGAGTVKFSFPSSLATPAQVAANVIYSFAATGAATLGKNLTVDTNGRTSATLAAAPSNFNGYFGFYAPQSTTALGSGIVLTNGGPQHGIHDFYSARLAKRGPAIFYSSLGVACVTPYTSGTTPTTYSGFSDCPSYFDGVGNFHSAQVIADGSAPTMAPGAAAGTSPTCTTITGANMAGVITCTTGTSTATGTLATITFNGTLGVAPQGCTVMPRTALTAPTATSIYTTAPSTTTWTIGVAAALTASTAYSWSYACE